MKRFNIVICNLDPTIGHEIKKSRPCVIISPNEMNDYLKTIIIAPMTTKKRDIPTRLTIIPSEINNLAETSYIALDQIKTIDKKRIITPEIGMLSEKDAKSLCSILKELFEY